MIKQLMYILFIFPFMKIKWKIDQIYKEQRIYRLIKKYPDLWKKCNGQ